MKVTVEFNMGHEKTIRIDNEAMLNSDFVDIRALLKALNTENVEVRTEVKKEQFVTVTEKWENIPVSIQNRGIRGIT